MDVSVYAKAGALLSAASGVWLIVVPPLQAPSFLSLFLAIAYLLYFATAMLFWFKVSKGFFVGIILSIAVLGATLASTFFNGLASQSITFIAVQLALIFSALKARKSRRKAANHHPLDLPVFG